MKNLKAQFKLIIFFLLFLNIFNSLSAKNIDKFSNSKDLSNYFSGIMAINDNQYKTSYRYFKSLNNLEESHYSYSQYYLYSLIALKKFKDSANYSIKLKEKNLDNFESNLISGIYYLKNNDFVQAKLYFKRLKNQNHPGNIQNLLSKSLNIWTDFENIQDINLALSSLNAFPDKFENMKSIQEVFVYCYFDSDKTDETFKKLTTNPKVNYSRYYFFHANYLISKDRVEKAKNILKSSLDLNPTSLILNQLNTSVEKEQKNNDKFDCKQNKDVIAEILYIVANGLASQTNYTASNFYLNLAKYLNPSFLSFDLLYAENLNELKQYTEALKIYNKTKKIGSDYSWHSSKRITSILKKQEKKKKQLNTWETLF